MEVEQTKYIRDKNSKAILQSDRIALDNYRMAKKQKESEINVINTLVNDVEELKNTIRQLQNDNKKRK
jgi:glycerol-3-phosphate responsive antiterminator|tara:strand:+ start:8736 stop:8939 length:204 start_codon:yes stop_codon:yes gene_type:complete